MIRYSFCRAPVAGSTPSGCFCPKSPRKNGLKSRKNFTLCRVLPLYHMEYMKAASMVLPRSLRPFFRKRSAPPLPSPGHGAQWIIVIRFMRPAFRLCLVGDAIFVPLAPGCAFVFTWCSRLALRWQHPGPTWLEGRQREAHSRLLWDPRPPHVPTRQHGQSRAETGPCREGGGGYLCV